ncbi:hypothetical protein Tco_0979166, partial [Tanacetum coccineum]
MLNDSDFDVLDDGMENVEGGSTAEQITTTADTFNTASINVSAAGPSHVSTIGPLNVSAACPSTSTAGDIFKDEMTTAQTLVKMRSEKAKEKGVAFRDVDESARPTTILPTIDPKDKCKGIMQEPKKPPKNPIKAQIQRDAEIAQRAAEQKAKDVALIEQMEDVQARIDADVLLAERLQQEEREQFTVNEQARMLVDLIGERKRFFAAQRAEQIRNKPPTKAQLRNKMKLYEREQKWINDFVPMDSEIVKDSAKKDDDSRKEAESSQKQAESSKKRPRAENDEESVKKQKFEDDAEKEELRAYLDIVPWDDIAVNVESLATKYPIVDRKTHILTENMMYYQIIRADGSSKNYKIFSEMLDDFDRQDVVDLYSLVKERRSRSIQNGSTDAKTLFAAIQTRFGGNEATKKTQKTLLKQMYENFSAPSTYSLDSIFNRLQKIVSQLAILGENISQEDL